MANRYSVLLKFLENLNSHLIFKFEGKIKFISYLITTPELRVLRQMLYHSAFMALPSLREQCLYHEKLLFLSLYNKRLVDMMRSGF